MRRRGKRYEVSPAIKRAVNGIYTSKHLRRHLLLDIPNTVYIVRTLDERPLLLNYEGASAFIAAYETLEQVETAVRRLDCETFSRPGYKAFAKVTWEELIDLALSTRVPGRRHGALKTVRVSLGIALRTCYGWVCIDSEFLEWYLS